MKPRDENPAQQQLGGRIRRLREEKGWTQGELARRVGLKPTQISRYEQGRRQPSLASLQALADALGTTSDHLARGSEPAQDHDARLQRLLARLDELPAEPRRNLAQILDALLKIHSYVENLSRSKRTVDQKKA